jgi:hypothetical protein
MFCETTPKLFANKLKDERKKAAASELLANNNDN